MIIDKEKNVTKLNWDAAAKSWNCFVIVLLENMVWRGCYEPNR